MKLKNCLGFLFYLHSLSLSPFSLTLALPYCLSLCFSVTQLTVSLAISFFSLLFFVIFQLFFLLCLLRLCAKHHRHILNAFWAVERGKGMGDRSSIYAEWLSELPLKRQQQPQQQPTQRSTLELTRLDLRHEFSTSTWRNFAQPLLQSLAPQSLARQACLEFIIAISILNFLQHFIFNCQTLHII